MSLISKAFSDIITFSRSSNATRIGPDGKVQYAPHNLLLRSQEFDNVEWAKNTGVTVTANSAAAPDGTVTADKIVYDGSGSSGSYRLYNNTIPTSVNGVKYTSSIWLRSDTPITVRLNGNNVAGDTLCNVTSTWQRFYSTGTGDGGNGLQLLIYSAPSDNTAFTIYAWGAQLSAGSIAGDYTPTTSAAVYGPRFDYDPVTLAAKGLLIEEQRTNLLTYSEDFTNSVWDASSTATRTSNTAAAPDGNTTADTITNVSGTQLGVVYTGTAGVTYTFSIWVKRRTGSGTVQLLDVNGNTSDISVTSSWQRFTITSTASTTTVRAYLRVLTTNDAVDVWGAQLEAGAFATSYIPTVASTVTRSADVASVNTLSPWFNATEGTLYSEYVTPSSLSYGSITTLSTDASNEIRSIAGTSGGSFVVVNGGSVQVNMGSRVVGTKQAITYKLNDFTVSTNGGTPSADTSGTVPSISSLKIGAEGGGYYLNGWIKRIAYYPRKLTNAELQTLTA